MGVVVSVGGQIPNDLALDLNQNGVNVLGTPAESIERAEDRERFSFLLSQTTCLPTSVPGLSKWLSGSWNRLLGWLSPQTSVNMSAVERENKSRNAGAAINFKRENNNLPAISPDGTLNWPWVSQGHIRQTNR